MRLPEVGKHAQDEEADQRERVEHVRNLELARRTVALLHCAREGEQ